MSEDAACPSNIIAQSTPAPSIPAVPHDGHDPVVDASASDVLADAISAETFYNNASRSVRALLVLCYGLNRDDGTPAIDVSMPPWKDMSKATYDDLMTSREERHNTTPTGKTGKNTATMVAESPSSPATWS